MKKLIFLMTFLSVCGVGFASDTNLGKLNLTEKQLSQSESLKTDVIKGFSLWQDGEVIAVSTRDLTEPEQTDLKAALVALPDEWTKEHLEAAFNSKVLMGDVYQGLSAESTLKLAPYTGALQSMMDWKNFTGISELLAALVSQGTMTQDEDAIIKGCFLNQGIDLDLYV